MRHGNENILLHVLEFVLVVRFNNDDDKDGNDDDDDVDDVDEGNGVNDTTNEENENIKNIEVKGITLWYMIHLVRLIC